MPQSGTMEAGAGQPCPSPFTRAPPLLAPAIHDPRDLDTIAKWVTAAAQCLARSKKKAKSNADASIDVVSCPNCFSMDGTGFPGHPCPPPTMM